MRYVILGNGYVGNYLVKALPNAVLHTEKVFDRQTVRDLMLNKYPSSVLINCGGKTGKPNVDWCEEYKEQTVDGNMVLPIIIAEACMEIKQPWVHVGSGCIYDGYEKEWTEEDEPNFLGSFYSRTKVWSQEILKNYDECCVLRIRMPIDEAVSEKSFVAKIIKYAKQGKAILSEANSMTFLQDLATTIVSLSEKGQTGTFNVVNPSPLTAVDIFSMYRQYVDKNFEANIKPTLDVLSTMVAGRSNCVLSSEKLEQEGICLPTAKIRLEELFTSGKVVYA